MPNIAVPVLRASAGTTAQRRALSSRQLGTSLSLLVGYWLLVSLFPATSAEATKWVAVSMLGTAVGILLYGSVRNLGLLARASASSAALLLLVCWNAITVVRGIDLDAGQMATLLTHPVVGGLVWLLPMIALAASGEDILAPLQTSFRLHTCLAVIWAVLVLFDGLILGNVRTFRDQWAQLTPILAYAVPVVLLAGLGKPIERYLYYVAAFLVACACLTVGNRTQFAMFALAAILAPLIRLRASFWYALVAIGAVACACAIALLFGGWFQSLPAWWFVDTRSFLFEELQQDFSLNDWLFGRGALGTYYSRYFDSVRIMGLDGDAATRSAVESGFLHIILKAGALGLALHVLAVGFAVARAISTNLTPGTSVVLIFSLLELVPAGVPAVTPAGVLLWLIMGRAIYQKPSTARSSL